MNKAFTLVEVLVGLALASIVLGVILNTVSRQTVAVSRNRARYQGMLRASQSLEYKMELDAAGAGGKTAVTTSPTGTHPADKITSGPTPEILTRPVLSDSRVEQVEASIAYGSGLRCYMNAYRLRVRRANKPGAAKASTN